MKFKEIKAGMVIHCKTQEEYFLLMKELERIGYVWYVTHENPNHNNYFPRSICTHDDVYLNITYTEDDKKITHHFSDLIIEEMSTEEVIKIVMDFHSEKYDTGFYCSECPATSVCRGDAFGLMNKLINPTDKVIEACKKYKSDHEKKPVEIYWQKVVRIIKVSEYRKEVVYEEEFMTERKRPQRKY